MLIAIKLHVKVCSVVALANVLLENLWYYTISQSKRMYENEELRLDCDEAVILCKLTSLSYVCRTPVGLCYAVPVAKQHHRSVQGMGCCGLKAFCLAQWHYAMATLSGCQRYSTWCAATVSDINTKPGTDKTRCKSAIGAV